MARVALALLAVSSVLAASWAWAGEPLVGAGVGTADTLVSEASKLFNRKQYPKARELFLKATRADPANLTTYLQLARAHMLAKELQRACYAYRVYLKAAPDSPERKKATVESDQCDRQLKVARGQPPDPTPQYVDYRAAFYAALDKQELLGEGGAAAALASLVREGFLGPELGEMAAKLGSAAVAQADSIYQRALRMEGLGAQTLRRARPLYQVAQDVGTSPPDAKERMAFLDGLAALDERAYGQADQLLGEAGRGGASQNVEYSFYRGLALFQGGDRKGALRLLEVQLRDDPRTAVVRTVVAVGDSAESGAAELEKLLFDARFRPGR